MTLARKGLDAALSALTVFLNVADEVLRDYAAAVELQSSSMIVRSLAPDVELVVEGAVRRFAQAGRGRYGFALTVTGMMLG